jgi:hypothetical protein
MQVGYVIAAIEIVIGEDLPVAVQLVAPPRKEVEAVKAERADLLDEVGAEKLFERVTSPCADGSKLQTPAKSGVPLSCPSRE